MSRYFEEARLVIMVDVVYDPDDMDNDFNKLMLDDINKIFEEYRMLTKNTKVELQGFICDGK